MTRPEVEERLQRFLRLVDTQQALKEELLYLEMRGKRATPETVSEQLQRQYDLVAEIERVRQHQMLPILEELAAFLGSQRIHGVAG